MRMRNWEPLEAVEGYFISNIVYQLHRNRVFERLALNDSVTDIAADLGYDESLLRTVLEFVYQTTPLVLRRQPNEFSLNPIYLPYHRLGFLLDKFIGGYGGALAQLDDVLRSPALGGTVVDPAALAQAFASIGSDGVKLSSQLLRAYQIRTLLDLGCGPAALLLDLALAEPTFKGWGIDESSSMCTIAAERVADAGLANRISVIQGDVRDLGARLPGEKRADVEALYGRSILNEFFRLGNEEAVEFVAMLKNLFPNRLFFVADYYGKLTRVRPRQPRKYRHTLLHDVVQAVSGQGIPPADVSGWAQIYRAADCSIVHVYEGNNNGIEWFIHVVRL
jgi:SAM-dependent methyltransferase